MTITPPEIRPRRPHFSSGPCAKPPGFSLPALASAPLGRSHRADIGKARLRAALQGTREILELPDDYKVALVPASDTGAVEMALWTMLGARAVEVLAWESFSADWAVDVVDHLKLDAKIRRADYGQIVDLHAVDFAADVVFAWNGTTSGVRVPDGNWIAADRAGLTICDATSAAFAEPLPWDKLDVATFSWQKALGGEAAHGMVVLSPRAVVRLQTYTPPWPLPKIFRLTKNGALIEALFEDATINTPSMLAVEDYLQALEWARAVGGLKGLTARTRANAAVVHQFCAENDWIANLAGDFATRSQTSVCLVFTDPRVAGDAAFAHAVAARLQGQGVAYDIGAYRDAPPGLRLWCGPTVETTDIAALMPWIRWAYESEMSGR